MSAATAGSHLATYLKKIKKGLDDVDVEGLKAKASEGYKTASGKAKEGGEALRKFVEKNPKSSAGGAAALGAAAGYMAGDSEDDEDEETKRLLRAIGMHKRGIE
jgi:hypothetical protein